LSGVWPLVLRYRRAMAAAPVPVGSGAPVRLVPVRAFALPVASFTVGVVTVASLAGGQVGASDLAVVVLASCLVWPVAAAVLLERRPGHPLGPVLCGAAVVPLVGAVSAGVRVGARPLPFDVVAMGVLPAAVLACIAFVGMPLAVGRTTAVSWPRRTWTVVLPLALAASGLTAVTVAVAPSGVGRPAVVPDAVLEGLGGAALCCAALWAHAETARARRRVFGADRDRLGWYLIGSVVLGSAASGLAVAVAGGASAVVSYALAAVVATIPAASTALLLSPAPPALDLALARVVAFTGVLVVLVVVYLGVVAGLAASGLPEGPMGAAVLTGTAALLAVPLWSRCRSWVEDLLFGNGRRPESVLRMMQHGVRDAPATETLTAVTDWVAEALRSPAARVHAGGGDPMAAPSGALLVPLRVGGSVRGWLEVAPRTTGERYGRRDRILLDQLAVPVALVAHTVAVNEALARSEQRVTEERARERRRVLDDLHDGLGPTLAGAGMQLSAARQRLAAGVPADERNFDGVALLDTAISAVRQARTDMRRLASDLDTAVESPGGHRGLAELVAELVDGWSVAGRDIGLAVELAQCDVPESLTAEVELAAYRIIGEAVTNVVRHAGASCCVVRLSTSTGAQEGRFIVIRVEDDGRGPDVPGTARQGVGLRSMRARAVSLGGRLEVTAGVDGGTIVTAWLPDGGPT